MQHAREVETCSCITMRREGACLCEKPLTHPSAAGVGSKSDKISTLSVASKPNKPCAFFNKKGGCRNGAECTFLHIPSAAGGGATPAPKKKVQPVNPQQTQICSRNVSKGDCPKCASGTCSFAASFEILAAAHAREINKNKNFTIDVSYRNELELEPYNGIPKSNGKIALSPATYVAWVSATMDEHVSSMDREVEKDAVISVAVTALVAVPAAMHAAFEAGASAYATVCGASASF